MHYSIHLYSFAAISEFNKMLLSQDKLKPDVDHFGMI